MITIDYKSGISICEQIINSIIKLKVLNVLKADDPLPSIRGLSSQLAVNPNTVKKAYGIMESSGIIYSVRGKGHFLAEDETITQAFKKKASNEFLKAVKSALQLGLNKQELIAIIDNEIKNGGNKP